MRNRNKLGYINKKGHAKTTSIIVLSVAVLIALLLLGLYTWKNRGSQPDENVVPSPTLSAVTIAPTVTSVPTQPPTLL